MCNNDPKSFWKISNSKEQFTHAGNTSFCKTIMSGWVKMRQRDQ